MHLQTEESIDDVIRGIMWVHRYCKFYGHNYRATYKSRKYNKWDKMVDEMEGNLGVGFERRRKPRLKQLVESTVGVVRYYMAPKTVVSADNEAA